MTQGFASWLNAVTSESPLFLMYCLHRWKRSNCVCVKGQLENKAWTKLGPTNEVSHLGVIMLARNIMQQPQLAEIQLLQTKEELAPVTELQYCQDLDQKTFIHSNSSSACRNFSTALINPHNPLGSYLYSVPGQGSESLAFMWLIIMSCRGKDGWVDYHAGVAAEKGCALHCNCM